MQKIVFILILFYSTSIFAQEVDKMLTLDDAINYATEHSPTLNIEIIKLNEASISVKESQLQYIPNIYLTSDVRRNLVIPATPVPANVFDPSAQEGELMYLKFNTKWNSSAGVNLNYDLFNPEKLNSVAEQRHQLKIQEFDALISEEELREKVALAYAECVIANEQQLLLKGDTAYYASLLSNANTLYLKEQISLSQKNDAHTAFNNSYVDYLEAEKIVTDRKAELLYLIGMDVTTENIETLILQEDIQTLLQKIKQRLQSDYYNLEEARQQQVVDLAALQIKSASLKFAPTLTLNGYYGTNYYNNELSLFNNNYWRGNSYIGLSIRVPITQSLTTAKEVSRLRLRKLIESENLRDIRNNRNKERLKELTLLRIREENYQLNQQNWEMSQQNSLAIQMQFDKGYIQQSDLLNEQQKIKQTRHQFLLSAYDLFKSIITKK
ncbi:MAG: TolC family protein [Fermentimonas sp.]|nr:TolC family protein [Fermentimonas sp.]